MNPNAKLQIVCFSFALTLGCTSSEGPNPNLPSASRSSDEQSDTWANYTGMLVVSELAVSSDRLPQVMPQLLPPPVAVNFENRTVCVSNADRQFYHLAVVAWNGSVVGYALDRVEAMFDQEHMVLEPRPTDLRLLWVGVEKDITTSSGKNITITSYAENIPPDGKVRGTATGDGPPSSAQVRFWGLWDRSKVSTC